MQSKILQSCLFIVIIFSSMNVLAEPGNHPNQQSFGPLDLIAYTTIGSMKVVSAAAAIPLLTVGEIGNVSEAAGNALWENASKPIGDPSEVTNHDYVDMYSPGK